MPVPRLQRLWYIAEAAESVTACPSQSCVCAAIDYCSQDCVLAALHILSLTASFTSSDEDFSAFSFLLAYPLSLSHLSLFICLPAVTHRKEVQAQVITNLMPVFCWQNLTSAAAIGLGAIRPFCYQLLVRRHYCCRLVVPCLAPSLASARQE